ncbi:carboxymuconolactone decarboxylase family protein [Dyella solisilvae]|uniref:Carboxymuconolactone decarboxylase family protein n=1 Tax=Dyella solisilvae TaxID=1920168 RepID=A0A370KB32_9GAMM|nr:carboxymuconolactone decarboxylase family protein [Dyella solisilvae]RDI99799.1 carboxymuconolactone decarboxylase family protein [Dyella solisilvae]
MSKRLSVLKYPQAMKPLMDFSAAVHASSLERPLVELVLLRVSQINGCAYCIDMHSKDARAEGETEQRLYLLQAWREAPFYTERECAALAWAEAVTQLGEHGVPDEVYQRAIASFSEEELVKLDLLVIVINAWNRVAIPFQSEPGHYKPAARHAA